MKRRIGLLVLVFTVTLSTLAVAQDDEVVEIDNLLLQAEVLKQFGMAHLGIIKNFGDPITKEELLKILNFGFSFDESVSDNEVSDIINWIGENSFSSSAAGSPN